MERSRSPSKREISSRNERREEDRDKNSIKKPNVDKELLDAESRRSRRSTSPRKLKDVLSNRNNRYHRSRSREHRRRSPSPRSRDRLSSKYRFLLPFYLI